MDPRLIGILERLRASRFAEVKGARASLSIPLAEPFLNELIAAALPPAGRFATCTSGRRRATAWRSARGRRGWTSCHR